MSVLDLIRFRILLLVAGLLRTECDAISELLYYWIKILIVNNFYHVDIILYILRSVVHQISWEIEEMFKHNCITDS